MKPNANFFVGDHLALELCLIAKEAPGPLTAYRLGKETEKPQASLERVLRKLTDAGALSETTRAKGHRRVKFFSFDPAWSEAVLAVVRSQTVGQLMPGRTLVLVEGASVEAAARLLRDGRYLRHVSWIAEFADSTFGVVLGLRDGVDRSVVTALLPELRRLAERPGGVFALSVARTFDQPQVATWAEEVLDGPADAQLAPGA